MDRKRTLLDALEDMLDAESDFSKIQEMLYRIYVLKAEKELEIAAEELVDLQDCKIHKDLVLRLCDFMISPVYTSFSEGKDKNQYELLKSHVYTHFEKSFYSIFEVSVYRENITKEMKLFLRKWWNHRENVVLLMAK